MFFLIKLIFKLATFAVFIFIGVIIYSWITGKNIDIGASELDKTEVVLLGDGSRIQVTAPNGWCAEDVYNPVPKEKPTGYSVKMGMIYDLNCSEMKEKYGQEIGYIGFSSGFIRGTLKCKSGEYAEAMDLDNDDVRFEVCTDGQIGEELFINATYKMISGDAVSFMITKALWDTRQAEVIDIIKTTKYIGAN